MTPTKTLLEAKLAESIRRMAAAKAFLAEGKFSSQDSKPYPLVVARASGGRVTDLDGNEWLDYNLGHGPLILGHNHPEVRAAVEAQLARGTTWGAFNEVALELAQTICASVPGIATLRYTASGTEAVFTALRFARAYTGKPSILRFEGAYHGHSDLALLSGKVADAPGTIQDEPVPDSRPFVDSAGIPDSAAAECYVAPYNNLARVAEILAQHAGCIACVIMEPIQLCLIPPRGEFLAGVRELTRRYGVLLVFDEVVTGFRVARGGAQELYGVKPDLTVLGKIMGGGFPNGAVGGPAEIMDPIFTRSSDRYVFHAGTFCGHPVAAAAGLAQLTVLARDGWYPRLAATADDVRAALRDILRRVGIPGQVLGVGSAWGVAFSDREVTDFRSGLAADPRLSREVLLGMWARGILYNATRNYLCTAHTDRDLEETLAAFEASLREALEGRRA